MLRCLILADTYRRLEVHDVTLGPCLKLSDTYRRPEVLDGSLEHFVTLETLVKALVLLTLENVVLTLRRYLCK